MLGNGMGWASKSQHLHQHIHFTFFTARVALFYQDTQLTFYLASPPVQIKLNFSNQTTQPTNTITMQFFTTILALSIAASTSAAVLPRQANSQSFTGALGGIAATPVLNSGDAKRPFSVKGDTFVNIGAALQRSCDQQFNACANAANGGNAAFSTQQCTAQKSECSRRMAI